MLRIKKRKSKIVRRMEKARQSGSRREKTHRMTGCARIYFGNPERTSDTHIIFRGAIRSAVMNFRNVAQTTP
jgi:hypothetical protein